MGVVDVFVEQPIEVADCYERLWEAAQIVCTSWDGMLRIGFVVSEVGEVGLSAELVAFRTPQWCAGAGELPIVEHRVDERL